MTVSEICLLFLIDSILHVLHFSFITDLPDSNFSVDYKMVELVDTESLEVNDRKYRTLHYLSETIKFHPSFFFFLKKVKKKKRNYFILNF